MVMRENYGTDKRNLFDEPKLKMLWLVIDSSGVAIMLVHLTRMYELGHQMTLVWLV